MTCVSGNWRVRVYPNGHGFDYWISCRDGWTVADEFIPKHIARRLLAKYYRSRRRRLSPNF